MRTLPATMIRLLTPFAPLFSKRLWQHAQVGARLPNLSEVAEDPNTVWKLTTIANWYGEREREVEITSQMAVWYSTGLFAVPVR